MFLQKLSLQNFRNYNQLEVKFFRPIMVLVGDNAQGKSNFLESIFYLSTTKSPKAEKDEELIRQGESSCRVWGEVSQLLATKAPDITQLEIIQALQEDQLSKKVRVNGVAKRIVDYIGNLSVVYFAPEDINLVTGSPSLRRWHIDLALSQIDREYKKALTNYSEVVTRRNRILKNIQEGLSRLDELTFWSDQLIEFGAIVSQSRAQLFQFLNRSERKFGDFQLRFKQNLATPERLQQYQAKEVMVGVTLIGPHRDDFSFFLGERDLAKFGSRGEQRSAVLDLKVGEVAFIEQFTQARPILLLDDVFSELDVSHKQHVLDLITKQQTIIATVELDPHLKQFFEVQAQIILVNEGKFNGNF